MKDIADGCATWGAGAGGEDRLAPLTNKCSQKSAVFRILSKITAFSNRWRVGSVLNNIPNSYNNHETTWVNQLNMCEALEKSQFF